MPTPGRWSVPLLSLTALVPIGCGDGDGPTAPRDIVPPEVTIVSPRADALVGTRPAFVIEARDAGSGIFCATIDAKINGRDFSQAFLSGCDVDDGEIRTQGQILLEEGGNTLLFSIADNAGNETTASRTFTVAATCGPPLCNGRRTLSL